MQFAEGILKITKFDENQVGVMEEDGEGKNLKSIFENSSFIFDGREFKLPEVRRGVSCVCRYKCVCVRLSVCV